ncbi:MAG: 4a-hydroxytetrahydrobiopterin dehydratase [Firmicutes bacterium]|nr:4a-hydroxytetrahydrobiopterin dehydratase [Bacillota bacterium]
MEKLTEQEVQASLQGLAHWTLEDKWIVRRYRFQTFLDGIEFVNRVSAEAEAVQHHPLFAIDYKNVTLKYTTWHAGGLTSLDFAQAAKADALYGEFSGRGE